jgi:hypothetical protein
MTPQTSEQSGRPWGVTADPALGCTPSARANDAQNRVTLSLIHPISRPTREW